jgi:HEAT repeat protein
LIRSANVPEQRILEATRGAMLARGAQGVPLLVEQLQSPDKKRFQIGLSTARELPGSEVAAALTTELSKAAPERAALIVVALGDQPGAALPGAVLEAARKGDDQVRLAAIGVVGRLGNVSNVPVLLEIAAEGNAELSQAAKAALTDLRGDDVNSDLLKRLRAAKAKPRVTLIELVGQRRIQATPELVKSLDDSDKSIRKAALTALGATVTPKDLSVLIKAATQAKNDSDRDDAVKALREASIRMPDREATATELAAAMVRASTAAKASLLRILGEMGGPNSLKTVAAAAKGDDADLRDVSTRVLGEWMTADAAPVLLVIANDKSPQNKYQTRALRGYLRIARQLDIPDNERIEMCRTALKIAERADERKLALEALKKCPSAESVELASALMKDDAVRDDAVEVAIFIGEKIKDKDPAAAKSAGTKALEASPDGELAERARALTSP